MPRRIWLVMTPEISRAPMSAPKAAAAATRSAETVGPTASASARAARTVAIMFEPVSPSGTGKTFSALTSSTAASRPAAAARKAPRRPSPSQVRRAIKPSSCDVGPAVGKLRRPEARGGRRRRRLAAGMELEAGDADRQVVDLPAERASNRVAHREIDLPGNLGDRQSLRDAQVHADRQPPAGDGDPQPAGPVLDPAQDAVRPVAGEARDAVLAEGHTADDVDDGASRDQRPTADGSVRHSPSLVRPARASGAARGAWYSTAPFAPGRCDCFFSDHPEVLSVA